MSFKRKLLILQTLLQFVSFVASDSIPYLTIEEHKRISIFLETDIAIEYPSDDEDASEILTQSEDETKDITNYKLASVDQAIFVSPGRDHIGSNVIVLLRGEDYMDPLNKYRFVVLRKRQSGNDYNVHIAIVWRDTDQNMHAKWDYAQITLTPNIAKTLDILHDSYLFIETNNLRPKCGWFGYILMCDYNETIVNEITPAKPKLRPHKLSSEPKEPSPPPPPRPKPTRKPSPPPAPPSKSPPSKGGDKPGTGSDGNKPGTGSDGNKPGKDSGVDPGNNFGESGEHGPEIIGDGENGVGSGENGKDKGDGSDGNGDENKEGENGDGNKDGENGEKKDGDNGESSDGEKNEESSNEYNFLLHKGTDDKGTLVVRDKN